MKEQGPKTPKSNVLSAKDFDKQPKKLQPYKVGDAITRDNFMSFFIQSFAISRGKLVVQIMFFRWLKEKYNFDYRNTMEAFSDAGGLAGLTKEEQEQFSHAYDAVSRHSFIADMTGSDMKDTETRKKEFDINISSIINETIHDNESKSAEAIFDLKNLNTFADFSKAAQKYFQQNPPKDFSDEYAL